MFPNSKVGFVLGVTAWMIVASESTVRLEEYVRPIVDRSLSEVWNDWTRSMALRRVTWDISELELPPGSFFTLSNEADDRQAMDEARKLLGGSSVPESK